MAAKKHSYIVLAAGGCGGGPASDPEKCWWAEHGETIKLSATEARPFLAQDLIRLDSKEK